MLSNAFLVLVLVSVSEFYPLQVDGLALCGQAGG